MFRPTIAEVAPEPGVEVVGHNRSKRHHTVASLAVYCRLQGASMDQKVQVCPMASHTGDDPQLENRIVKLLAPVGFVVTGGVRIDLEHVGIAADGLAVGIQGGQPVQPVLAVGPVPEEEVVLYNIGPDRDEESVKPLGQTHQDRIGCFDVELRSLLHQCLYFAQ